MATIFHLALASDWQAAEAKGLYTVSTRGRTLAEEGFIHASRGDQWPGVRSRYYADVAEPLLLLQIDTDLLDVPLIDEPNVPGGDNYPHIYGPLPVSAVVRTIPLEPTGAADPVEPDIEPTTTEPTKPETDQPKPPYIAPKSFSRVFLQEMFFNAGVLLIGMLIALAGLAIGDAIDAGQGDRYAAIGGLVGLVVGIVVARAVYVRRKRRATT